MKLDIKKEWEKLDADLRPPYHVEINSNQINICSDDHVIATMSIDHRYAFPISSLIASSINWAAKQYGVEEKETA